MGCGAETPDLTTATIQNVGLVQTSGVPPLGEGIAPIGGDGGDGAPVVTQVGGWSGGPGAVRWHGGQWVVPYSARPGATLLNASCDVVPRADASALVELVSSNGQVLGSATVPATTANIVIRAWPFLGTHVIADGEQIVMRISPCDAATGAWTSAAQDMTVIGCAVNTTARHVIGLSSHAFVGVNGVPVVYTQAATFSGSSLVAASIPLQGCAGIASARVYVKDSTGPSSQAVAVLASTTSAGSEVDIASSGTSLSNGTAQTLSIAPAGGSVVTSGVSYWLAVKNIVGVGSLSVFGADVTCQ